MQFTDDETMAAANLFQLVKRQISMGVPEALALPVLAAALGQTAHDAGVPREELARLVPLMVTAWDGAEAGATQARHEAAL